MPPDIPKLDPREEHFRIPGPRDGMSLFLRYLPAMRTDGADRRSVLFVHGATFASALSIAHRFEGYSWRDALNEAGFDVWALDFYGFGYSDRYPEMNEPAESNPPLCNANDAGDQVEAAARFLLGHHGVMRFSLVTHSWGSMPAGRFAGKHPAMVDRWVLFGPEPALVQAPVALIRGEWDGIIPYEDARRLFDAFSASPIKRDVKISRGTHQGNRIFIYQ